MRGNALKVKLAGEKISLAGHGTSPGTQEKKSLWILEDRADNTGGL